MDQSEIIDFLTSPAAAGRGEVEVIGTHCALVFLSGDVALKLKRAVRYDYLDQSTPELRHALLQRELALNAPVAPEIYRDVLPVTLGPGGLALGGDGAPVDWVLRMWRFPAGNQLDAVAARGEFSDRLATETGRVIAAYHAAAPVIRRPGAAPIDEILSELGRVFAEFPAAMRAHGIGEWREAAHRTLDRQRPLLDARGLGGDVRRGHGDLHLRNIVLLDGRPVPFDALEFSEELGTCDVLYDTAFLIMDLGQRGLWRPACRVLDAWLREARGGQDAGVAALPLFLSVRAAIRAMVLLQTDAAQGRPEASSAEIAAHMALARAALAPPPARLIAIGGYSGTGKSLLAAALAPELGALPGAVWLASDQERKVGLPTTERLPAEQYSPQHRQAVYRRLFDRATALLQAGQSVILDATFLDDGLRGEAEALARSGACAFSGLWLEAPPAVLLARVVGRVPGASDADVSVLQRQLATAVDPRGWQRLDAAGPPEQTLAQARQRLAVAPR